MKSKRGSHVDVIISFVIFIGFVVFFYAIIQPNVTTKIGKTAFLDFMGGELIKNLTGGDLMRISTGIQYAGGLSDCVYLDPFATSAGITSFRLNVKNSTGAIFPASYSGNNLYINMSQDKQNNYLFSVYYSSSFSVITSGTMNGCKHLTTLDSSNHYSIGQIENYSLENYIWENNIKQLISLYNSSYATVKDWFNLSASENFRFDFTYQNQTVIGTGNNIPASISVYSQIFPVVYISQNSSLEAGNLIVRAW